LIVYSQKLHKFDEVGVVFFVEDNEAVRAFTVSALKTIGYTVLAAANGKAALNLIKQNKVAIDLIITDVIMPEMGGKELADSIIARNQKAKILFTSGYTDNHILNSSTLNEGINFIHKPFSIESMATKIRQVLDN